MFKHFLKYWNDKRGFAVVTCNNVLPDTAQKTDFYALTNGATVTSIEGTDISASANIQNASLATLTQAGLVNTSSLTGQIANSNLTQLVNAALVSGAALTLLPNIPSGAGLIPGANIGGVFGAWVTKTVGQIYQALTDGIVVYVGGGDSSAILQILTDSSSTPTTIRATNVGTAADSKATLVCPVRKNDYYKATTNENSYSLYFLSLGS